jgi:phage-related protein
MKAIRVHKAVSRAMKDLDISTRNALLDLLALLAKGMSLGMPVSRHMPSVAHGVHELRIKDRSGQYRVFYFTKHTDAVLVFHMFKKKTEATPKEEISLGKKRLKEMI